MRAKTRTTLSQIIMGFVCFLLLFGVIKLYRLSTSIEEATGLTLLVVARLLWNGGVTLKSTDDRTNILLLGVAGGAHEAPDLTDTIIIISFHLNKKSIALLSVPRDIWSDTLKDKINSAYHYGEKKKKGGGMVLARAVIEDVTGLPIHYTAVVDFSQFEKLISIVGGIDVTVPTAFTDTEYPIAGKENDPCDGDITFRCRYTTVQFTEGRQHMDGETALQYVRSRHAEGDEGSDFARGKRQQDIIIALKEKIIKLKPWLKPQLAMNLYRAVDAATDTNMTLGEQLTLGKLAMQMKDESVSKLSIEQFLIVPPSWMYGRYILVPADDFGRIHEYIQQALQ